MDEDDYFNQFQLPDNITIYNLLIASLTGNHTN